jgi:two-component system, OmpR family, response regulator
MAKTDLQPKKLLIVEDEGDMCLLMNIMLTGNELEVEHVKNLASAADYLKEEEPAVIIMDNKLPDGFGIDYIPIIKKNYPEIKLIMISGFDGSARDVAIENGADIFLEKPFTKQQLFDAVQSLMKAPVVSGT